MLYILHKIHLTKVPRFSKISDNTGRAIADVAKCRLLLVKTWDYCHVTLFCHCSIHMYNSPMMCAITLTKQHILLELLAPYVSVPELLAPWEVTLMGRFPTTGESLPPLISQDPKLAGTASFLN
jgi:hypothetical protein